MQREEEEELGLEGLIFKTIIIIISTNTTIIVCVFSIECVYFFIYVFNITLSIFITLFPQMQKQKKVRKIEEGAKRKGNIGGLSWVRNKMENGRGTYLRAIPEISRIRESENLYQISQSSNVNFPYRTPKEYKFIRKPKSGKRKA
jgi:hypothetical protein